MAIPQGGRLNSRQHSIALRIVKPILSPDGRHWSRGGIKPGREVARADGHGRPVPLGIVRLILERGGGRFEAITNRGAFTFRRGARLWSRATMTAGLK